MIITTAIMVMQMSMIMLLVMFMTMKMTCRIILMIAMVLVKGNNRVNIVMRRRVMTRAFVVAMMMKIMTVKHRTVIADSGKGSDIDDDELMTLATVMILLLIVFMATMMAITTMTMAR